MSKKTFDFDKDVLERSFTLPILVDFWAAWCGPCRVLGPLLEQLVEEQKGTWELIKIDTEEHQSLASTFQIMSIPAVKLFHHGQVIAEFQGALPKHQIENWLTEHLPTPIKGQFQLIKAQLAEGPREQATQALETFLKEHPEHEEASVLLAKEILFTQPQQALQLVEAIKFTSPFHETKEDLASLTELLCFQGNESAAAQKIESAREAVKKKEWEEALSNLIESITIDKGYEKELGRRATISIFHYLGEHHSISKAFRPKFSMALY
ncbi:MAG: tetratricopeptide repeat protein [Bacteroidota bacterium]